MAQIGNPNENAMAERVFRTLKEDFGIKKPSFSAAQAAIEKAIHDYNAIRPHASLGYDTPNKAHLRSRPLH
ncbi:integrase core domain-containing protein [Dyadobacter sandarakinus]|uniref:Transposase n=1 Tax=Dyadobacter sandarakinus TaxID=2747268 RepID=A0ABX7I239_9BACT|nr:integrase core domain-containing protein [Dyadobacter sandarakinus]QRR00151.1 transposase [Dyadobacter sandarakinus]